MQGLPSRLRGFNLQPVQLMERFSIFFLSQPIPGVHFWFYPHFCVWSTHRNLVLRLPWSSWVCPCEDQAQRWYDCLDCRSPGSAKCAGKLVATGARDMALVLIHFLFYLSLLSFSLIESCLSILSFQKVSS